MVNKTLITQLSANTRKTLAKCRALAMSGKLQIAIDNLDEGKRQILANSSTMSKNELEIELVSLSLLKAELLHLDLNDTESFSVLRSEILTKLNYLPNEIALAINQNRAEIEIPLLNPETDKNLNSSYDERELIGIKFWDPENVVYAYEYAANGAHYDALPAFQQELESAYRSGNWLTYRQAARRIAVELIQIGGAVDAIYQTVIAQDSKLIGIIGQSLLASRNSQAIKLSIQKILKSANLKRHAIIASEFFKVIFDAIPDDQFDEVFHWLLLRAELEPTNWRELSLSISVWESLFELHRRLTKEQGKLIVDTAVNHPMWKEPNRLREKLLQNVNASVPHLTEEELLELAKKSLPSATDKQDQVDYPHALNLVCHIAERSEEAKKIIGDTLYSSPTFENFQLSQIAPLFNRGMVPEDVEKLAFEMAFDIRKQIQFPNSEEKISRPMSVFGTLSTHGIDDSPIIHMYGFDPLNSLLEHRKHLSKDAIKALVNASLDMILESENIPANKTGLLKVLIELSDCLTTGLAETIFEKLSPIVEGTELKLPSILQHMGNPNNPLNAFKFNFQTPEEVQAGVLFTLAKIEEHHPGVYGEKLKPLVEEALTSPHSTIRKYAFSSIRKINILGETINTNLFLGTQDPDATIVAQAFLALAQNEHLKFSETEWLSLCHLLTLASNSSDSVVRRDAAYVIAKRQSEWEKTVTAERMKQLKTIFANDVCYSVRATATQND